MLVTAAITLHGCTATTTTVPAKPPSLAETALVQIVEAQQYSAQIAQEAGTARGQDRIGEAAYKALTASGAALDAAWRAADRALIAGEPELQRRLDEMAEAKRNLEAAWRTYGPRD